MYKSSDLGLWNLYIRLFAITLSTNFAHMVCDPIPSRVDESDECEEHFYLLRCPRGWAS